MHPILEHLKHRAQGKIPAGSKRSGEWPRVRKEHLAKFPNCAVCGGKENVEVHHKKPFHLHPELELEPTNLISLCEAKHDGVNCHLLFGHLGNFKSLNESVEKDASCWAEKIKSRP
jgi:5-methylcytosine-specific restriction endonuclease McrA